MDIIIKKLTSLKKKRSRIISHLSVTSELISQLHNEDKLQLFIARLEKLSEHYTEFQSLQREIQDLLPDLGTDKNHDDVETTDSSFEELYYTIKAAENKLNKLENTQKILKHEIRSHNVKPPTLTLPKFDGKIEEWPQFFSLFKSMIHDKDIYSDIEKYYYLLSCLSGAPQSMIKAFPIIDENYLIVWNTLVKHYQNSRVLFSHYSDQLLNMKPMTSESAQGLSKFIANIQDNLCSLQTFDKMEIFEMFIAHLIIRNLDHSTKRQFELQLTIDEIPTSEKVLNFLHNHERVLQMSAPSSNKSISSNSNTKRAFTTINNNIISKLCKLCRSNEHNIMQCPEFVNNSVEKRSEIVKTLKLCFNCLKAHKIKNCLSKFTCIKCKRRHHSLLHINDKPLVTAKSSEVLMSSSYCDVALLGTASADCKTSTGAYTTIRMLLDSGSQISIMSEQCAKRIGLKITTYKGQLKGIGQYSVNIIGEVRCTIKPKGQDGPKIKTSAIVISNITSNMPSSKINLDLPSINISRKELADDNFDTPGKIDFLLGATLFPSILDGGRTSCGNGTISVLSTIFGLVLIGNITNEMATSTTYHVSLDQSIKRFWSIEEPPNTEVIHPDDVKCEEIFVRKHIRQDDGRYVVPLTLSSETIELDGFYNLASNRLRNLERKLIQIPEVYKDYKFFMDEYERLGHMELVPRNINTSSSYFIPHHCVLKPNSISTKLRVVFDASAKNQQGVSLNQYLLPGPKLQNDISNLILRFRIFPVVFTADICKMYRQILVLPEHRQFQHILWRSSIESPVCDYELKTVTYGLSCAPYLAIRTLHQLVKDEGLRFPRAAKALIDDFYVDDLLTGAYSVEEAILLRKELVGLLAAGKFTLSKWASNYQDVLSDVSKGNSGEILVFGEEMNTINILGLNWNPQADTFFYTINEFPIKFTKREILSRISQIYDPLGWLSPVVFKAKCLIQTLWRLRLDWDSTVPLHIQSEWQFLAERLNLLSNIQISRYYNTGENNTCSLVGFSDASELGYAAVVYIVVHNIIPSVHLLMAKSKVAPLKTLTIPRLELSAALLLSRIMQYVHSSLQNSINISSIYLYTDSTIVLSWLKTPSYLLKIFVANRVVQIHDNVSNASWGHVVSQDNPADCASRGLLPEQICDHPLWFSGPKWLLLPQNKWPSFSSELLTIEELPDVKSTAQVNVVSRHEDHNMDISKYSSLTRVKRIFAWIMRFVHNCKRSQTLRTKGCLTVNELRESMDVLIKMDQRNHFGHDLNAKERVFPRQLQKLCPFVDQYGILRVGGRLEHSNLQNNSKHPIVLSKISHLSGLLIDYYHKSYLHAGPRVLQFLIQQKFWILSARSKIKSLLSKCITCTKLKASFTPPLMGNLPSTRVTPRRPFSCVGIDLGGPFSLRDHKRRGAKCTKAYICLFVCMTTKAIHLELVSDLSTDAFIAALDRFVSRRGFCSHIYTDCGSNFIGANRYYTGLFKFMKTCSNNEEFMDNMTERGIQFHFNPPSSPHFGGLWEAGIRSVKYHIKRVIGDTVLTFEEFSTLLSKIEAVLNSRPLCSLSNDPNEVDALTPGHFLIGDALLSLPEWDFSDTKINRLDRWQHLQQMSQHFWRRWSIEYLQALQQREKWFTPQRNVQNGDIVIMKDSRLPPLKWQLGRIIDVKPGTDGVVRVVSVKTKDGIYLRPVVKVCPLPVVP